MDRREPRRHFGQDLIDPAARRADLAAIMSSRMFNPDPETLERMVYGPQPLTDASRATIVEWCDR